MIKFLSRPPKNCQSGEKQKTSEHANGPKTSRCALLHWRKARRERCRSDWLPGPFRCGSNSSRFRFPVNLRAQNKRRLPGAVGFKKTADPSLTEDVQVKRATGFRHFI